LSDRKYELYLTEWGMLSTNYYTSSELSATFCSKNWSPAVT